MPHRLSRGGHCLIDNHPYTYDATHKFWLPDAAVADNTETTPDRTDVTVVSEPSPDPSAASWSPASVAQLAQLSKKQAAAHLSTIMSSLLSSFSQH